MLKIEELKKRLHLRRLTLFDILLIFLISSLIFSVFFFLFRTKKELFITVRTSDETPLRQPWEQIKVNSIKLWNSPIWMNNLFYKGMSEKDNFGNTVAEVINVRKYDNRPENPTFYLTVKLNAVFTTATSTYTYKGKNILVGSLIQLHLDDVLIDGLIVNVNGEKEKYPLKKIRVTTQIIEFESKSIESTGVEPFVADNIQEGKIIKDNQDREILKIISKRVEDAKKIVVTNTGEVLLRTDPIKKDVYLTLELMAFKVDNRYYFFDDIPILVDKQIPIHLEHISIFPKITSIE